MLSFINKFLRKQEIIYQTRLLRLFKNETSLMSILFGNFEFINESKNDFNQSRHEQSRHRLSQVPDFKMSPSPGPGSRFPGPGLRDPGDPVPDADPWSKHGVEKRPLRRQVNIFCKIFSASHIKLTYNNPNKDFKSVKRP